MQAIQTKYFGPTYHRGSRIKAQCAARTIYESYDYALDIDENHRAVALRLKAILGWVGDVNSGTLKDGSFVHVLVGK